MHRESAPDAAFPSPLPASGWAPWPADHAQALDVREPDEPHLPLLGAGLSLLMWGCASVLAVWYL